MAKTESQKELYRIKGLLLNAELCDRGGEPKMALSWLEEAAGAIAVLLPKLREKQALKEENP